MRMCSWFCDIENYLGKDIASNGGIKERNEVLQET